MERRNIEMFFRNYRSVTQSVFNFIIMEEGSLYRFGTFIVIQNIERNVAKKSGYGNVSEREIR